jgi:hypothetical protein
MRLCRSVALCVIQLPSPSRLAIMIGMAKEWQFLSSILPVSSGLHRRSAFLPLRRSLDAAVDVAGLVVVERLWEGHISGHAQGSSWSDRRV